MGARRFWLAAAAALAALFTLASISQFLGLFPVIGVWGCTFGAGDRPYTIRVLSVDDAGSAAKAGLLPGDETDLRRYDLLDRYGFLQAPIANRPVHLVIQRGLRFITMTGVPISLHSANIPRALRVSNRTYHGGLLLMCLFAGLIAWQAYTRRAACILSLMLSIFVIGEVASPYDLVIPWPSLAVFFEFISQIAYVLPIALFATFASSVSPPISAARRNLQICTYVVAAIALIVAFAIAIGQTFLSFNFIPLFFGPAWTIPQNATYLLALLCGVMAFAESRGIERQLVGWATSSAGVLFISQMIATVGEEYATTSAGYIAFEIVGNTGVFLAPIGLTYALLTHRLLDIGFVLNRAAVFTGVSLVIFGMFGIVEFVLSEWIRDASHLTGTLLNIGLALFIGFSIRPIHTRVDRVVDQVFFRKRYEDEQALRDFAHEAAYITDPNVLVERAIRTVEERADASDVAILLLDDSSIDPDDEALVAMRAFYKPIELRNYRTALKGEYAFPMGSRGHLIGTLICGLKRGGEAYAPDEFNAITQLAHSVGTALDMLRSQDKGALDILLATQREMLETLRNIQATLVTSEPALRLQK